MFRRTLLLLLPLALFAQPPKPAAVPVRRPKLVLAIVIDQFRYDYLTRFRSEYTGGLKRLLDQGAVFTNARYDHIPTVTAVGHSTFLTGATPSISGIVGNNWWERETTRVVSSVSDDATKLLGATGTGSSPRRMLPSTLGDELKISGKGGQVVGVSIKDRSAILPAGHMADGAYWLDAASGNFVSSTYYFASLPSWVTEYNATRPADKYAGTEWMGHKLPAEVNGKLYSALEAAPGGNELIQDFALKALAAMKLGKGPKIDVLTVSFSANDYVGHRDGPDSPEVHDMALRVDKLIGKLIQAAEAQTGLGNVIVVLTADHGVSPVAEVNQNRKMPGGRLNGQLQRDTVEKALVAHFGGGKWVVAMTEAGIYFSADPMPGKAVDVAEAERVGADALRALPHIFRVYTRTQMINGAFFADPVGSRAGNGFFAPRAGNIMVVADPYWMISANGTTHSAPFSYDTHVPILFLGPGIKPGRYHGAARVNDIAATLSTMLDVETPSGCVGRVLDEMLLK